jgi:phage gp29-like protein
MPRRTKQIASRKKSQDFFYNQYYALPNMDPTLKCSGQTIEIYDSISYDSRVKAVVQSRKSKILAMEWQLHGEDEKMVEWYQENVMSNLNVYSINSEMLDAFGYGYKVFEINYRSDNGKLIPIEFVGKPQRWFSFDGDNNLQFITKEYKHVEVPDNKFVVVAKDATYDNPYGEGAYSGCYWPVTFRRTGFEFWTNYLEKYGSPYLTASCPSGMKKSERQDVADTLTDAVQDCVFVVPEGTELELVESKTSGTPPHQYYIDMANLEIAMAIVGTNLTTEVQGGSLAASVTHNDIRKDIIDGDKKMVEQGWHDFFSIVHSLNFGDSGEMPALKLIEEKTVNTEQANRDKIVKETNPELKFTEKYLKESYNYEDEDVEFNIMQTGDVVL